MKQWIISYQDKDGEQRNYDHPAEQRPTEEEAARILRKYLYPVTSELDLNDLEGRTAEPTVKSLDEQNSVKIISIAEAP
ncbi:hypothetical protein M2401_001975 [Pseudomonas sp. JUb42]|jgi:hypothetical protein|uniref:hypothetical protein n=1 Tax=Pseudomonas sp. JUb42 TaxID=2940611 RepID=UPI0021697273|nr:hypothetical protein [Pseudomonas sp. JUb42]MCS3468248.1 hypothetical protein [Pseudomonas sp. JUb42]